MSNAAQPAPRSTFPDLVPLLVGVTGHRDLREQDREALRVEVQGILNELQSEHPATPLAVLSSLAEGADRLVAQVALDMHIPLYVPLPMPREEYLKDFKTEPSRVEFNVLLEKAEKVFEAHTTTGDLATKPVRDEAYKWAGIYVIRHSQVLIALWDGQPAVAGKVGTATMVQYRLEGVPETSGRRRNALDPGESGPVFHIAAPRQGSSTALTRDGGPALPGSRHVYFPENFVDRDKTKRTFAKVVGYIDRFNGDIRKGFKNFDIERNKSGDWLVPPEEQAQIPRQASSSFSRHALADSLARHYQVKYYRTIRCLLALVVLANVIGLLREAAPALAGALSIVSFLMLGAAYVWFFVFKWQKTADRFLDYRALAEGMRVQFFWRVVGLRDNVPEHYLRKLWSELDWIRQVIWVWLIPLKLSATHDPQAVPADRLLFALKHWVQGQRKFFGKYRRFFWIAIALRALAWLFAGLSLVLTILLAGRELFGQPLEDEWKRAFQLLMALSLPLAAVVTNYAQVMGYKEHAKRYEDMLELYLRADKKLAECIRGNELSAAQEIVKDLGREALLENGDWLLYHRERSIELK
jgi:hypothetical protein